MAKSFARNSSQEKEPVFKIENLHFSYGGVEVLSDINLTIQAGERWVILGANGSGKSTLLKLLDGLYFATAGRITALGMDLTAQTFAQEDSGFNFRRRVGLVFQDPDVQLFSPTVWDEVAFAPLHLGLTQTEVIKRTETALRELEIGKLKNRPPYLLSGGEKKKVALASILSLNPEVWLFDEPTASLDPRSQSRLLDFMYDLGREKKTLITATHDLGIVADIADMAVVLSETHQVVVVGTPQAILSDTKLLTEHNLIHEHRHKYKKSLHRHPHIHTFTHTHQH